MMEHLWAPWRNSYIVGDQKPNPDIFAEIAASSDDESNHVLFRSKASFAILNRFPYNTGHLMVLPYRQVTELLVLSPDESADLWNTVNLMTRALKHSFQPLGFNIGINIGQCAGAGVPRHLHVHVVPRWPNDSNFMTTTSETRVHPNELETVYSALKKALSEIAS